MEIENAFEVFKLYRFQFQRKVILDLEKPRSGAHDAIWRKKRNMSDSQRKEPAHWCFCAEVLLFHPVQENIIPYLPVKAFYPSVSCSVSEANVGFRTFLHRKSQNIKQESWKAHQPDFGLGNPSGFALGCLKAKKIVFVSGNERTQTRMPALPQGLPLGLQKILILTKKLCKIGKCQKS